MKAHSQGLAGALRALLRGLFALLSAGLLALVLYQAWVWVQIGWWVEHNPSSTAFMRASLDRLQATKPDAALRHEWVEYERISIHLKRAILIAEDDTFVEHEGFNWEAMQHAIDRNQQRGKVVSGGSTISQQLAKNLFLSGTRSYWRKGQEALVTVMLESRMDKRRILEIYLNVIEWGDGVFGAEAAARHYYKVSASQLSREQAARLAAMVPRPRFYERNRNAPWLNKKTEAILARMHTASVP